MEVDQGGANQDNAMDAQPTETTPITTAAAAPAEASVDYAAMTEEEQLEWALRMSMADSSGAAPTTEQQKPTEGEGSSTKPQEEKMDVDDSVGQLADNPELLQQLIEGMPDEPADDEKVQ
jgi:26S proteasome regulatory subunit N10